MKILEKIALALFSVLILIESIIMCLVIFGWLDLSIVHDLIFGAVSGEVSSNILLGLSVVFILLAIKCIFFDSSTKDTVGNKEGILLENDNGQLLISKDTLENLVNGVVQNFESAENVTSRIILDKENNVKVFVTLYVRSNAVIKDLTTNLQTRVKEAVKKTSDLDVKEVNVRVRNIVPEKENPTQA